MNDGGVRAAVEALVGVDLMVAGHGELAAASRAIGRLQSFVDLAKVQIARRGRVLADAGDTTSNHVLIDEARCSGNDARATDGRDRVCGDLPEFEAALADGEVTGAHLDALDRATKGLSDVERADVAAIADDLVADASTQPASLFERTVKTRIDAIRNDHRAGNEADELDRQRQASTMKRWTDRESGMKHTLISLDPLRDASLHAIVDAHLASLRTDPVNKDRPFDELKVQAVINAVQAGQPTQRVPEIVVHVDHESLCHGRHDATLSETIDGQPLPVSTVQRLCCGAVLQAVVVNPDGTVDRICAEQRTASRAQRRQLAAMYATCAHPLCDVGFSNCRMHHIVWFSRGGKTVLSNLVPLCETHHHLVHEGGWNLEIDGRRAVTWLRPDGSVWKPDDGPNRRPASRARAPSRASPAAA